MKPMLKSKKETRCNLSGGCCSACSKKANVMAILGFIGLVVGIVLIVVGSVNVAKAKHLPSHHDVKGGFIGMIVVGCLAFLFGIVMISVAAVADLTVGLFSSWVKPDICPNECSCC